MIRKISSTLAMLAIGTASFAQLKVSGSIDAFTQLQTPYFKGATISTYTKGPVDQSSSNIHTSFTDYGNKQLNLGMASVKLDYTYKKWNLVGDFGFGQRATEFAWAEPHSTILSSIKQAYASYSFFDKFKLTAGTWATHVGYEVVDPFANKNYSLSYLFTNGPFTHTGIKGEYVMGKQNFMLGLTLPADRREFIKKDAPQVIAQYGYTEKDWNVFVNYYGGLQYNGGGYSYSTDSTYAAINQIAVTANYNLTSKLHIGYDGTIRMRKAKYGDAQNWIGNALYLNHQTLEWLSFNLRGEYIVDKDGIITGVSSNNILEGTLSANITAGNFIIIPEIRYDSVSKEGYFYSSNSSGVLSNEKGITTFLLAGVYKF